MHNSWDWIRGPARQSRPAGQSVKSVSQSVSNLQRESTKCLRVESPIHNTQVTVGKEAKTAKLKRESERKDRKKMNRTRPHETGLSVYFVYRPAAAMNYVP